MRHRPRRYSACLCAAACAVMPAQRPRPRARGAHYRLAHEVPLPGDEGWDYLAFEPRAHRLFISHGTRVLVVDAAHLKVVGEVARHPGRARHRARAGPGSRLHQRRHGRTPSWCLI